VGRTPPIGWGAGDCAPPRRVGPGISPGPLTGPCVSLSTHTARTTSEKLPPSAEISRFLLLPVDRIDPNAGGPPPSLHGHDSASAVLRGSPSLIGASVLSASGFSPLRLFPWHRQPGSQVPYESPDWSQASGTPDIAWPVSRFPSDSFPELGGNCGFDVVYGISMRHRRFTFARLSNPYMT